MLGEALRERALTVVETREPGGTPLGERLRAVLLEEIPGGISLAAEALLFAAARAELVRTVIKPALERGDWVVCDRYLDSSLAYQGAARGLGIDAVDLLNAPAVDGCMPDHTIVIDAPVEVALARRDGRPDRIEGAGTSFQSAVAAGYRLLAERHPDRISVVSGDAPPEQVHAAVIARLEQVGIL